MVKCMGKIVVHFKHLSHLVGLKYVVFSAIFLASTTLFTLSFLESLQGISLQHFFKVLGIGCGAFLAARSMGMIVNQIVDVDIDQKNKRTACRVLPTRQVSMFASKGMLFVCLLLFLGFSACLNWACGLIACVSVCVMITYPYTKQYTWFCHWILGSVYYLAVLMNFLAFSSQGISVHQFLSISLLGSAIAMIIAANDIIYAIQDIDFDRDEGLFSIPSLLGRHKAVRVAQSCLLLALVLYLCVGMVAHLGWQFYVVSVWVYVAIVYHLKQYSRALLQSTEIMPLFFYGNIMIGVAFFLSMLGLFVLRIISSRG